MYRPALNTSREYGILRKLRNRKDIGIVKRDKGSRFVYRSRDICNTKSLEIISDTAMFKKLEDNPVLFGEGQLQRFLRKTKDEKYFR